MKKCYACKQIISDELIAERKKIKGQRVSKILRERKENGLRIGRLPLAIDTQEVNALRDNGLSIRKIASKLGVSSWVVWTRLEHKK